ncbi:hypothetical protein HXX76_013843 [Chlamydomonas incerta]|uniref:Uncharacterized protein n=1 Tax=Chlamydomonas incerta TaxID=51695 RepID=A0A835SE23_CHLIN|nr:hypothetical protein HXX76_013843 [Chlamydomonas incerta]|eukprot:KAG2425259.1 hypothetical protein HXX76_013843 [Chlamydomonas incerta]
MLRLQVIPWFQAPSWYAGLLWHWLRTLLGAAPELVQLYDISSPDRLPPPGSLRAVGDMHALSDSSATQSSAYMVFMQDASGIALSSFLTDQGPAG